MDKLFTDLIYDTSENTKDIVELKLKMKEMDRYIQELESKIKTLTTIISVVSFKTGGPNMFK